MNTSTYTVNRAGATSLRNARPMTFGLNRYVTANVVGRTVAVFVGLTLHFDGDLPKDVAPSSAAFYAWVREVATVAEGRECD